MPITDRLPDELDVTRAEDIAWIKSRREADIWHQAMVACICYRGDEHGFLPWLVEQPDLDRSTAAYLLLRAGGGDYFSGDSLYSPVSQTALFAVLGALCERSETLGFRRDNLALEAEWEAARLACLDVAARGAVPRHITVPHAILDRPFVQAGGDWLYEVDGDGLLMNTQWLHNALPHILGN